MKILQSVLVFLVFSQISVSAQTTLEKLINELKSNFGDHVIESYTFVQQTIRFTENGTDTSTWYEAVQYPNNFRIDFNAPLDGNSDYYVNDTLYAFRNGVLKGKRFNPHPFLLFEGQIYSLPMKAILEKMEGNGINTNEVFCNKTLIVFGSSDTTTLTKPQVWLNRTDGSINKIVGDLGNGQQYIATIEKHNAVNGYIIPKTIRFDMNGKTIQLEHYNNINTNPTIPLGFFDTQEISPLHWFNTSKN